MQAVIILLSAGVLIGLAIALVVKFFGVQSDPLLEEVTALTPGANCGACGYAGCAAYAAAMVSGAAKPGLCPSMPEESVKKISALLGVTSEARVRKVAVVCCRGNDDMATRQAFYNGVNNCRDAMQVAAGAKTCTYGCLGLGACARACPYGAIEITPKHLAVVHPDLCVGCGKCVQTCPKKLIKLVPASAPLHVLCSSPEKGVTKRKACKAACIGCQKCVKAAGEGQIRMNGFLAVINYGDLPPAEIASCCPTGALSASIAGTEQSAPESEVINA
ncbi:MAG: 4Fe-4S binding protein [Oligosphaeraceae bacterium]|nr:4Fe-4S binding protein [Oligosphaeraceae bacterium]